MDKRFQKSIIKLTLFKKTKFRFVIEFHTMITCIEAPKLHKQNPHLMPMKRHEQEVSKMAQSLVKLS